MRNVFCIAVMMCLLSTAPLHAKAWDPPKTASVCLSPLQISVRFRDAWWCMTPRPQKTSLARELQHIIHLNLEVMWKYINTLYLSVEH